MDKEEENEDLEGWLYWMEEGQELPEPEPIPQTLLGLPIIFTEEINHAES